MALSEGQMLGAYKIMHQIGQGGMATIYKAYHARLDRVVAIKVIHHAFAQNPTFLARFEREAQIIARLEHPHIIPIYDYDEMDQQPYLVMKYVEGTTLKGKLTDESLPLTEIVRIMRVIAGALDYAHSQGVLHRDIKPSNIIIDHDGTPYLTDFGLARSSSMGESTISADMLLGTPQYISPEQALGNQTLSPQTDLYSLGVVLYELVVGRVPFNADTPYAVIHDHIYSPLPAPSAINPQIPPQLEAVLMRALAKSPAARYPSATELINAFERAVNESGLTYLAPDRGEYAEKSLAALRDKQTVLLNDTPTPMSVSASSVADEPFTEGEDKRKKKYVKELDISLESVGEKFMAAFENWDSSALNPSNIFGEGVPKSEEDVIRRRIETNHKKRNELVGHIAAFVVINAMIWILFNILPTFDAELAADFSEIPFPIALVVTLGWGAGLVAHFIDTRFTTGDRLALRDHEVDNTLSQMYGRNWYSAVNKPTYNSVLRHVNKINDARKDLAIHLGVYVMINIMLWIIFLGIRASTGTDFPWPFLASGGWGIGLFAHAVETFSTVRNARTRESDFAYEMERERQRARNIARDDAYDVDKPKRKNTGVRLTEDGELTDSVIAEWIDDEDAQEQRYR